MDAIFDQYQRRFTGFRGRFTTPMPLYLMRTRDEYVQLLAQTGVDARHSGGMFMVTPKFEGLVTWTTGRSRSQSFMTLQHEGFHQFAWHFIGHELPVWMNEGLAQYFEDAIIIGQRMTTGLANAHRIEIVRDAIARRRTIDFAVLLELDDERWRAELSRDPEKAALMYAQSWSMVFYLVHGEGGKYQRPLERYLSLVAEGQDHRVAFRSTFGSDDLTPLEARWRDFARNQQADPVNTAAARMEYLGAAMRFLYEHDEPVPKSVNRLKQYLQVRQFALTTSSHGVVTTQHADDDRLYVFQRAGGSTSPFTILEPARSDLLPRITALGLRPEPTLIWSRDEKGELVQEIEFR